ncbi:MAG: HNH endonuclease, partial [Chloroflexi bacterium]|nr:HNH endonuclease [Chloroflexota bacterium]
DRLWEIPEESQLSTGPAADIRVSEARRLGITGGFRQDVHDVLCRHPELVSRAAHQILSDHFPSSIHQTILDAVRLAAEPSSHGLDEPMPRRGLKVREYTPRDPRFRRAVLEAYDERCAVCEYDIRFGDRLLGLEAAHIRWHSHDGRDVVPNGLALCGMHHKALDLGAMGLEGKGGGFRILISRRVRGRSPAARRLVGLRGSAIRPPASTAHTPDRRFVEWHREEVFRG